MRRKEIRRSLVTGAAVSQASADVDLVRGDEFGALRGLVTRRLPRHVENFVARPNEFRRIAVAIETPLHVKVGRTPRDRHLIDAPMAGSAADAFARVNAVVEPDVIRKIIDAVPLERRLRGETLPYRREHGRVRKNLRVATHARLARGHAGER